MSLPPFETVVADHGQTVLRVCRAVLGPQDAEDAWSETFLSALRAYPSLRPDSNIRAWLVTIAHRKAIDGYRVARRAPLPVEQIPELAGARAAGAVSVAAGQPDAGPDAGLPDEALGGAVAALPFKQRAAVAYRYLADMSYPDIGALLGSSEAAARRSAADGIAALRKTYARAGADVRGDSSGPRRETDGERNHDDD